MSAAAELLDISRLAPLHAAWQDAARQHPELSQRERWHLQRLTSAAWHAAVDEIRRTFAAERGWIIAKHTFSVAQLCDGRHGRDYNEDYAERLSGDSRAFDHPNYFRLKERPYRPAGIVVHVYANTHTRCRAFAMEHGLAFEPLSLSWHYPGGALAGIYMRRGRA